MVRCPPRERKVPGSNPACAGIFSGSSHTSDLNIGTPVATLPGAWRYRVSAGTGQPGVSILWLGEMEGWICSFYLSDLCRSVPEIHSHVAGTLSNQQTSNNSISTEANHHQQQNQPNSNNNNIKTRNKNKKQKQKQKKILAKIFNILTLENTITSNIWWTQKWNKQSVERCFAS